MPTLGRLADIQEDDGAAILAMQGMFYRAFSLVNGGREVERIYLRAFINSFV